MRMRVHRAVIRPFLHITRYTLIQTVRSTGFRFLLLCSLLATLLTNGFLSLQLFTRALSQSVPFCTVLLYNAFVTFSGPFIIVASLDDELRSNAVTVLFPRSYTTAVYIVGKASGVIIALLGVCTLDLVVGIVFNTVVYSDSPISAVLYVLFLLLGAFPVVVFVCGFSFLFAVTVRHTAARITIPALCLLLSQIVYSSAQHGLFDIVGWHIPFTYSDFTGFADFKSLLMQRAVYVIAGVGFIAMSAVLFSLRRLRQSKRAHAIVAMLAVLCFASSVYTSYLYISHHDAAKAHRRAVRNTGAEAAGHPGLSITDMSLDLKHNGDGIEVSAGLYLENRSDTVIDTCLLSLNPAIFVESVTSRGRSLVWHRNAHVLTVPLDQPIAPGHGDTLSICYKGTVDDHACYSDIPEEQHERDNTLFVYNLGKRYGYVTPSFVLLTRESMWYPETAHPSFSQYPAVLKKNFTSFHLTVQTDPKLTVISQGDHADRGGGVHEFSPEKSLPQISLVIGRYEHRSVDCGGVTYSLFTLPGHDPVVKYLHALDNEDVIECIKYARKEIEGDLRLDFTFKRLSVIEVPVHFLAHQRYWHLAPDTLQPEQVLVHECGVMTGGYLDIIKDVRGYNADRHDKKYQLKFLRDAFNYLFSSVSREWVRLAFRESVLHSSQGIGRKTYFGAMPSFMHDYNIFPQYYCFTNDIDPESYPLLALSIGYMIKAQLPHDDNDWGLPVEMLVTRELSRQSLADMCSDPDYSPYMNDIIRIKSEELSRLLAVHAGKEEFAAFLSDMLKLSGVRTMDMNEFLDKFAQRFDVDIGSILSVWQSEQRFPHFVITDIKRSIVQNGRNIWHQYRFTVTNTGPVAGVITLNLYALRRLDIDFRDIFLEPFQSKEIGFTDSYVWGGMYVITCNALNERRKLFRFLGNNSEYGTGSI